MKYLLALTLILSACAPATTPPGCDMSYACNGNMACINNFHTNGGNGTFQTESDCLLWETAFLNSYVRSSATACSCH